MSFEIEFEHGPDFLRATVTGKNSPGAVAGYLDAIRRECEQHDAHKVLIVERLEGPRLGVDDVFTIASEGASSAMGVFHAIAYVDEAMGEMAYFAETVAINRGMPVKVFLNVAQAERWLAGLDDGPDGEQQIFHGDEPDDGK